MLYTVLAFHHRKVVHSPGALDSALSQDAEPLHTTVRNDGQLHVSKALVLHGARSLVLLIRPALDGFEDLDPPLRVRPRLPFALPVNGVDLGLLGEVAAEVRRVDDEALDERRRAQADDRPVDVVLAPGPRRLPAVSHVLAAARQDQVVLGAEVLVAAGDGHATVLCGRQVEDGLLVLGENRDRVAEQPEPRDTAVRVHVEPHVRVLLGRGFIEFPTEALLGPALVDAQDGLPFAPAALPGQDLIVVLAEAPLDGDGRRVVAGEVRRVDLDASDGPGGDAQPHDDPVEGLSVVPPRLPAVVPGARVDHLAGLPYGGRGRQEVVRLREPLVRNP